MRNSLGKNQTTPKKKPQLFADKKRGIPVIEITKDQLICRNCENDVYCGKKTKPNPSQLREDGTPICYSLPEGIYDSSNNK